MTGFHCVAQAGLDDIGTIDAQLGTLLGSHLYGSQGRVASNPISTDLSHCLQDIGLMPEPAPLSILHLCCNVLASSLMVWGHPSFSWDVATGFWILGNTCSFADHTVLFGPGI